MISDREGERDKGDPDSKANQEQKQILGNLNQIADIIDTYRAALNENHLITEIREYDKTIKEYDKMYVTQDNKLLNEFGTSGQDDYLPDDELKLLFS